VIHAAERHEDVTIDYARPAGCDHRRSFSARRQARSGEIARLRARIGVPGTVAGLALALEKYGSGTFTLAELLKPSIALARDGVVLADDMADTCPESIGGWRAGRLGKIFSAPMALRCRKATGWCRRSGATLTAIADQARTDSTEAGRGEAGGGIRDAGGIMTAEDLKSYSAEIRARCAAAIAAMTSSRCRCHRPAASCWWRC